jgi:hypothetical protein
VSLALRRICILNCGMMENRLIRATSWFFNKMRK